MAKEKSSPILDQVGSQLDTTLFAFDDAVLNPDRMAAKDYERMIDSDETVGIAFDLLSLSVLMRFGEYEHSDQKIADFINRNFEEMEGNLHTALEEILSALWAGYSGTEIIWKAQGSQILLNRLVTYHPATLLIRVNPINGLYIGLKQWRWFAGSPIDLPKEKVVLFTHGKRFGNYYGRSILKRIRKNWILKDPILKMMARALSRFGAPFISAVVPDEMIADPASPEKEISQLEYAVRILKDIENGTGIALRSGGNVGSEPKITVHDTNGSGIGQAFESALNYLNKMIARGLLAPSLIMDEGQRGAYSLGKSHSDTYDKITGAIFWQLSECLLEQLIRPMIEYNFGIQKNYGNFQEKKISEADAQTLTAAFSSLTTSGYLDPQIQGDFDAVRSRVGLPQRGVIPEEEKYREKVSQEYKRYKEDGEEP